MDGERATAVEPETPQVSEASPIRERSWRSWLPAVLFLVLAALVYGEASRRGGLELAQSKDSSSYLDLTLAKGSGLLKATRTVGYPLLLRVVQVASPDRSWMPHVHYAIFLLGGLALWHALWRLGVPSWTALMVVLPLPFSELLSRYGAVVMTDTISAGASLFSLAALCHVVAAPRRPLAWLCLVLATLATYHLRPAYLFLILLVPLVGGLLFLLRGSVGELRQTLRRIGWLAVVAVLPFFLFATFRWAVVGHWGLVSFGGYNTIGIAGSLLTEEVAARVDPEYRSLAEAIVAARAQRAAQRDDGRFTPFSEREFENPRRRLAAWYAEYNPNIWKMAVPLAAQEGREKGIRNRDLKPYVNRQLAGLSKEALAQHRGEYLYWVVLGWQHGLARTVTWVMGLDLCLGLMLVGWMALATARALTLSSREGVRAVAPPGRLEWLWLIAGTYFAGSLLLIVLVEPPMDRYLHAAGLLLPGVALATAWDWTGRAVLLLRDYFAAPAAAGSSGEK